MKGDPRPRRGGLCARKGCKKKAANGKIAADKTIIIDPFCSTQCCKVYYGVMSAQEAAEAAMHAERSRPHHKN